MHKPIIRFIVMLALSGVISAEAVERIYVKPSVPGGDGSGDSWANAMTNVQTAIDAVYAAGGGEVWLAQGIYYPPASIVLSNTVAVLGGFPGVSEAETHADRDADAYRAVISGDVNRDDIWERFDPMDGEQGSFSDRGPIIEHGELALPAFESARDTFSPKDANLADNLWRVFDLAEPPLDASAVLDGVWIVSGGRGNRTTTTKSGDRELHYGGAIYIGANSTPTIRNCRFVGCHAYYGIVYYDTNRSTLDFPVYDNNVMQFNRAANRGGLKTRANNLTVKDSAFIGNYRTAGSGTGGIYLWSGTKAVITNCYFERNYTVHGVYSAAACISAEGASWPTIVGSVFTNNTAKARFGTGAAAAIGVENVNDTQIRDCLFVDNYSFTKATSGDLNGGGVITASRQRTRIENCTFLNNVVEAESTSPGDRVFIAPVYVFPGQWSDGLVYLLNSTFRDNQTIVTHQSSDDLVFAARAVLSNANRLDRNTQLGIANCTFSGATAGSDLVWTGVNTDHPITVINSVFWSDHPEYVPLRSHAPGRIVIRNSIVQGYASPPTGIIVDQVGFDDPLLTPPDLHPGGYVPTQRLGAKIPGARKGLNVFSYPSGNERHLCYERSDTVLTNLVPLVDRAIPAGITLIDDANYQPREADDITVGAVQDFDAAAETGSTLTLRATPQAGGNLTGGHSVQVLQPGETSETVTAVANSGFEFEHWQREDESIYTLDAALTVTDLTEDLLLYALFTAESVTWTFNLGVGATFDAGGHTVTNLTLLPGAPAPAVPAFTVDEASYLFDGWSPSIPSVVGTDDQTFTAQYIAKIFRIVRVAPEAPGSDGSGTSWANSMTNLQEAIDLAGLWQGEVWLKQGIHLAARTKSGSLRMRNNVAILGGFAGYEGETKADRDPSIHFSVISGDINGNDCWADDSGANILVEGQPLPVWNADGTYVHPNPDGTHHFWQLGNRADNVERLFDHVNVSLDATAILDGVVLSGASGVAGAVMYNGLNAHPTLIDCLIIANNGGIRLNSWMTFHGCSFIGNRGPAVLLEAGNWEQLAEFHDLYFEGNSVGNRAAAIASNNPGIRVYRSVFYRNYANGQHFGPASTVGMENGSIEIVDSRFEENFANGSRSTLWAGSGGRIVNCVFINNQTVNTIASGTYTISGGIYGSSDTYVESCSFIGNTASLTSTASTQMAAAGAMAFVGHRPRLVNCTFYGNSATATTSGDPSQTAAGTVMACNNNTYGFLVNCSFHENSADDGDFVQLNPAAHWSQNVYNTIFWNSAPGYVPFKRVGDTQVAVFNSTVRNWDSVSGWITESSDITTADPSFRKLSATPEGLIVLPLSGNSPVMRGGLDVFVDANGVPFYDAATGGETPQYRRCDTRANHTPAQPFEPIPDAIGSERPLGKFSLGVVQTDPVAFLLLIR